MMYGLDIGGTKTELAIFDQELRLLTSWRIATPQESYPQFLQTIIGMVEEADRQSAGLLANSAESQGHNGEQQDAAAQGSVGIGIAGFVDQQGCGVAANIPCINGQPFARDVPKRLGRPVGFENDVKAFVLSESQGGAAAGVKHALGIVLGTGLAGGLCIDGQIYYGRQNIAGEYGHIQLSAILQQRYQFPLLQCGCGALGCVESYLSGPGLLWMCSHFGGNYLSVPKLIQGVQAKETKAQEIFTAYIDCLGSYFSKLILLFDPDVIVLGGGLSNIAEIYQLLPEAISCYLFAGANPPPVVPPRFGASSGVRGAALLGQQAMLAAEQSCG